LSFTNVNESFRDELFLKSFTKVETRYLEAESEVDALVNQLNEDINLQEDPTTNYLISIKQDVELVVVDQLLKKLGGITSDKKVLMALTGTQGHKSTTQRLLSLAQTDSRSV
jgi:hypothetical protein